MDFDEYDYLERMVDNSQTKKIPDAENEGRESDKSGEKERTRGSKSKSNDDEYDGDMHSKHEHQGNGLSREKSSSRRRSRSRDAVRDRHKSSAEHRERERDGVRHRNREDKNGRDRDRDRGRDRGRDREREHDGDRQRDSDRRVNDRDGERVRDREASHRGRSSSGMLQDREEGEKSRGRDIKERDGEFKERNKEIRKKKEDKVEPEADPERDQRTVFAYQISLKADERDVYEFFSRAGKVRDVRLIMDRITRRSKGVGYVEFYDAMSVPMAIALSGQPLLGLPVMVKPSEAEKNLVQPTASTAAGSGGITNPYSGGARRLYVGNLNVNITEDQLRQVFESFGAVELVQLPLDMTGQCKGFGFVQFSRLEDAAWYFEIKVVHLGETGHTRLGWSNEKGDLQAPVGYDENSFGYRDTDGSKIHKALREGYGAEGYKEGDVIGCYISLPDGGMYAPKPQKMVLYKGQRYYRGPAESADQKEDVAKIVPGSVISFFKNGICQGVAYKDISGGRYYPAASMYTLPNHSNCLVRFNFGPEFDFFPEDFGEYPSPRPMIEVPYQDYDVLVENGNGVSDENKQ